MRHTLRSLLRDKTVMESLSNDYEQLQRELELLTSKPEGIPALEAVRTSDLTPRLDVILQDRENALTDASGPLSAQEAIILLRGRPVLLVQQDSWEAPLSTEIAKWLGDPTAGDNRLRPRLPSVGRIEIVGDEDQDYIGTGWMLDEDILITNRHVAEAFAIQRGHGFAFKRMPDGSTMQVRTDFKREHQRTESIQFGVRDVVYIAPAGDIHPDMALLRLDRGGAKLPSPIELDDVPLSFDPNDPAILAVVGYPAEDPRNDAMVSRKIFDGIYRVKRLSPGRIMGLTPNGHLLEHDCTTLGGNSGSPVINLKSGRVCGLHFSGTYRSRNTAVTAGWLKTQLAGLETRRYFLGSESQQGATNEANQRVHLPDHFANRDGYQADFLSTDPAHNVSLPEIDASLSGLIAAGGAFPDGELKYCHFSIVMRQDRKLPFFTAVNIDGSKLFNFTRGKDVWFVDGRLDTQLQTGEALYQKNPLDRGHLVRRLDPTWGQSRAEAQLAEEDTFHFTNCSPQHEALNQRTWLSLEDYILGNANTLNFKASIFSGPVMAEDDTEYRGIHLPKEYWKVAVMVNENTGSLSATGYLLSQAGLIDGIEFVFGAYKTYQVAISLIESKTGLKFGLELYDPLHETEGTPVREVFGPESLVL